MVARMGVPDFEVILAFCKAEIQATSFALYYLSSLSFQLFCISYSSLDEVRILADVEPELTI